ncbi:hypothetical protein DNTS_013959 [Danionella cerebrum]|uniref:Protein kinase domain-containing protein n=1 Tax=Danionella cerebrum TaxID=2873325 RepID=A0A553MUL7_9TELE|nr:hypothetical protein DNTS_013959 [Danionella translucida]
MEMSPYLFKRPNIPEMQQYACDMSASIMGGYRPQTADLLLLHEANKQQRYEPIPQRFKPSTPKLSRIQTVDEITSKSRGALSLYPSPQVPWLLSVRLNPVAVQQNKPSEKKLKELLQRKGDRARREIFSSTPVIRQVMSEPAEAESTPVSVRLQSERCCCESKESKDTVGLENKQDLELEHIQSQQLHNLLKQMAYSTKTLAGGCFGKVYKEKYGDTWAAIKRVPLGLISQQQLERECKVYHNARHPNIVKLLGDPWLQNSKWNIPLEFIFGEDLETTIFKVQLSKIQLTPAVRATIITGMCEGLLYMHSKDIVHQDLKPDNIMVEHQTHRAVIIDLGLAKFSRNGLSSAVNLGNEAYSPPEILQMNGIRDKRSDVWAMGKIIAELCARIRLPTQFVSSVKILETLKDQPYSNPVSKMVEVNPSYRTSMAGVIAEIRRAGSMQLTDLKPKDISKDIPRDVPRDFTRDVPRDVPRDIPRDVPRDIPRVPVPQANELKQITKWSPPAAPIGKVEFNRSPLLNYRKDPTAIGKAVVTGNIAAMNQQFSLMSFPCPLPETGKVTQQCFNEEKGALEYKEIITKGGKIVKYEKVQITKDS